MIPTARGCSYAACPRPVMAQVDGWGFCRRHLALHEVEKVGAPAARSGPRPKAHPCGSPEAYRRHVRKGERPCAVCAGGRLERRAAMMLNPAA